MLSRIIRKTSNGEFNRCAECNYLNKPDSNFCSRCGTPVIVLDKEQIWEIWQLTEGGKDLEPKYCEHCGEELRVLKQMYCPNCGEVIDPAPLKSVFKGLNT
ncbi:MAG: zinc-ribbon domain-containing protein [Candidatus Odinarchaeota archaeon]